MLYAYLSTRKATFRNLVYRAQHNDRPLRPPAVDYRQNCHRLPCTRKVRKGLDYENTAVGEIFVTCGIYSKGSEACNESVEQLDLVMKGKEGWVQRSTTVVLGMPAQIHTGPININFILSSHKSNTIYFLYGITLCI